MIHRHLLYRPAVNPGASRAKSAYINLKRGILRIYVIISFFEKTAIILISRHVGHYLLFDKNTSSSQ